MELQICEIKKQARVCGHKTSTDIMRNPLFSHLVRHISFKAFELINREIEYIPTRGASPNQCLCYLRRTHGLPCACQLQFFISNGISIPLGQIDRYWRTLDIDFQQVSANANDNDNDDDDENDNDDAYNEVDYNDDDNDDAPPALACQFAEQREICAPPTVEYNKKVSKARVPSAWERVMKAVGLKNFTSKKGKGRVAGINATQNDPVDNSMSISDRARMSYSQGSRMSISQGPGGNTPASPSTPTSQPARASTSAIGSRKSRVRNRCKGPYKFQGSVYEDQFPPYIRDYIDQCTNVLGDGNCGFRAVAHAIYGSEDQWKQVRADLLDELTKRPSLYKRLLGVRSLDELEDRLNHESGPAPEGKYFELPECGHLVATRYNVVLMSFSAVGGYTCLPAILDSTRGPPSMKVVLGNVDGLNHWILMHMTPGNHPVPWLAPFWKEHHHSSAEGLDRGFKPFMGQFNVLHKRYIQQNRSESRNSCDL